MLPSLSAKAVMTNNINQSPYDAIEQAAQV